MKRRNNLAAVVLLLLLAPVAAHAQTVSTDEHKFEVGAQLGLLGLEDANVIKGLGGRAAYNLNENFAIDGEATFFPEDALANTQSGQIMQGFVGIRAGKRFDRVGVFAKARPGAMFIGGVATGFDCDTTTLRGLCRPEHNAFAMDLGGVVEFYPTSRAIIRADVGDTMVQFRRISGGGVIGGPVQTRSEFTHNLQISVGFGYRF